MIVLDTSFTVAVSNPKDAHHEAATAAQIGLAAGCWGSVALLEYVLLETTSVLLKRLGLRAAQAVGQAWLHAAGVVYVPCSPLWPSAWERFTSQADTLLSLTDVAIAQFALAHAGGKVLSFDLGFGKLPGIVLLPLTR